MKKPTRYSKQSRHNDYGVRNWFKKMGVVKFDHQERLKAMFLEDHEFEKGNKPQQDAFISNRWEIFTRYMQKNIPLFIKYRT